MPLLGEAKLQMRVPIVSCSPKIVFLVFRNNDAVNICLANAEQGLPISSFSEALRR
jgi:hypothetical protein